MEWYIILALTSVEFESYIYAIVKGDCANFCFYPCLSIFIIMIKMVTLHLNSLSIALLFSSGQSSSWGSAHCVEMVHLATFPTHHAIC